LIGRYLAAISVYAGLLSFHSAGSRELPTSDQRLATAQAAANAGDFAQAEEIYKQIVAAHPSAGMYQRLGLVCHLQNKFPEAARAFAKALELDSSLWTSHLFLAMDEYRMNHFSDALAHLDSAERGTPGYPETLFWKGATHLALHDYWNGFEELEKVLENDPANIEALRLLAENYADRGTELLNKVAEQYPDSAAGLQVQGRAFEFEGSYETALRFYRAAAVKDPKRPGIQEAITRLSSRAP
jgi:tetratricopeptide (TPR) repeat protein